MILKEAMNTSLSSGYKCEKMSARARNQHTGMHKMTNLK